MVIQMNLTEDKDLRRAALAEYYSQVNAVAKAGDTDELEAVITAETAKGKITLTLWIHSPTMTVTGYSLHSGPKRENPIKEYKADDNTHFSWSNFKEALLLLDDSNIPDEFPDGSLRNAFLVILFVFSEAARIETCRTAAMIGMVDDESENAYALYLENHLTLIRNFDKVAKWAEPENPWLTTVDIKQACWYRVKMSDVALTIWEDLAAMRI